MKINEIQKKAISIAAFVIYLIILGVIEYYLISMMTDVLMSYTGINAFHVVGTLAFIVLGLLMIIFRMNILLGYIREYDTWEKITLRLIPKILLELLLKSLGGILVLTGIIILLKII